MTLQELSAILCGNDLSDISLAGFLEPKDSPPSFNAMLRDVYFEFRGGDGRMLKISAHDYTGRLTLEITLAVSRPMELDDTDYPLAISSIFRQLMWHSVESNLIEEVRLWEPAEDGEKLTCYVLCFKLNNGQEIVIDALTFSTTLVIGGKDREAFLIGNGLLDGKSQTVLSKDPV